MKLKATKAWQITYEELEGLVIVGNPVTVTTDYGITFSGPVHNIQHNCLKIHIGTNSFAAVQFRDVRKLETEDVVIEPYKEVNGD